jgi:hypothetical protein
MKKYTFENLINIISTYKSSLIGNYDTRIINVKTKIEYKCNCGNVYKKPFENIYKNGALCKECSYKIRVKKAIETNLKKYGVNFVFQLEDIKKKIKETNKQKYNCDHISQTEEFKEKRKQTCLNKYGVENNSQTEEFKEKIKQTCLEKYNTKNIFQSNYFKEKSKQTCLDKYGVKYITQTKEFKEKSKETCMKKFGVSHPSQTEEFKEKSKETCIKKFGVSHPSQNSEIAEKMLKNSYKRKEILKSTGEIIFLQGYEPIAYKILLKSFNEEDIISDKKIVPELWWKDNKNKNHRHFVDFYIKSTNTCVEIKSTYTFNIVKEKVLLKQQFSKLQGYNYEIWIFDKNENLDEKIL